MFLAAAMALAAAGLLLTGVRRSPPVYSRQAAERALRLAESAEADRWAPEAMRGARLERRAALDEFRRQELRFFPLRDFRRARMILRSAEAAAILARDLADQRRASDRDSSQRSVERSRAEIDLTEKLLETIRLDHRSGEKMRQATIHVREAELLWERREYGSARLRADQAALEARQVREQMASALARYTDAGNLQRWRKWREELISRSSKSRGPAILVNKDEGLLTLYLSGRPARTYQVELGQNHLQRKIVAGDKATPEGRYTITVKKDAGRSKYHKALELDYPSQEDRLLFEQAKRAGAVPPDAHAGGLIEIHGEGGRGRDWTDGCISLRNGEMDDLFGRVPRGTPVTIIGGDGAGGLFSGLAARLAMIGAEDERRDD